MSDETPRTTAKQFEMISDLQSGKRYVVSADFARQLERELNEALADKRRLLDALKASLAQCTCLWTNINERGEIMWGGQRQVLKCDRCFKIEQAIDSAMKGQG